MGILTAKKVVNLDSKSLSRYRTFTYPQINSDCLQGNKINLPKLGKIKVIVHRPIPEGFKIKTVSISKKADGFYVTLSLEDKTIPEIKPDINPHSNKQELMWV